MKYFLICLIITTTLTGCRPQIDTSVLDASVFDYHFGSFIQTKNDTIKTGDWVQFEMYLKPISTSLLREPKPDIILKTSTDKDLKILYELVNNEDKKLSETQRVGDVVRFSSYDLKENLVYLNIKVLPPNEKGAFKLKLSTEWNSVVKEVQKNVVVR